jgi:excisionase family DNA binding protein
MGVDSVTMPDTPWLTIEQVAERWQCSVRTVERAVAAGTLAERRPHPTSRARRYHVEDVDAAMKPPETDPQS